MKVFLFVLGDMVRALDTQTMNGTYEISFQSKPRFESSAQKIKEQINPKTSRIIAPVSPLSTPLLLELNKILTIHPSNICFDPRLNVSSEDYLKYPENNLTTQTQYFSENVETNTKQILKNLSAIFADIKNQNAESTILCLPKIYYKVFANDSLLNQYNVTNNLSPLQFATIELESPELEK